MIKVKVIICILLTSLMASSVLQAIESGDQPVDFTLQSLGGGEMSLKEFRGRWVVLNYWATWCAPCRKEIPELSALHDAREDIIVLGLAFEDTEIENFEEFLEKFQPSYPMLLVDVYAPPEPFGAPRVLPTTIVLNPQGIPAKTFLGPVTREQLEEFISQ